MFSDKRGRNFCAMNIDDTLLELLDTVGKIDFKDKQDTY